MKVILCTPFIQSPEFAQGGLVVWGANIINYYKSLVDKEVELVPISFDRRTYAKNHKSKIGQFVNGIKELWRSTFQTVKLLKRRDFDAVHVCTSTYFSLLKDLIILWAAKHYGVRGYVHFHCGRVPDILKASNWEHKLLIKVASLATKCITMDLHSFYAFENYGIHNIVNLPNPLSLSIINQVTERSFFMTKVPGRIAFVGHVIPTKGIQELVESCCMLGTPDLHIIGKLLPNDKAVIDSLLSKYNTKGEWITWVGEIPHENVIDELLQAEVFAFPTYTEGFPNVILEAMVCKCAIVTTTVGAIPEMLDIENDACGVCVEPKNTELFYNALSNVYGNSECITEYSNKAFVRVNEQYTINNVWNQMVEIWSD
ncbi:MAG: glycosyltransferase family 4 protein [Bacteroidales bacterium]|nr:glycosyltransferase family 4 protein [Bacteroidales bacterium]